ncbi:MAG TPA: hypothetical protein VMT16_07300, partial [Thermoanaerobaculia bacterium]|nr:hypothetical protein [Thermoanaerobaculia bacterium]
GDVPGAAGSRLALRQVAGAAAWHLAPRRRRLAEDVAGLRQQLAAAIHQALGQSLPDGDLDALAEGLAAFDRPDAELGELTGRVEKALASPRVDVLRLRRLVSAARELADLATRLDGVAGTPGRAPLSLVLGRSDADAGASPWNPWRLPTVLTAAAEAPAVARGLAAAQVAAAVDEARALRRARLELERPGEAAHAAATLAALAWGDLADDERALCPPVLLWLEEGGLDGASRGELLALAAGELPVVAAVAATAAPLPAPAPDAARRSPGGGSPAPSPALLAATAAGGVAAQVSFARPAHWARALAAALDHPGGSLLSVHAPPPATPQDAATSLPRRAEAEVAAGRHPLFLRPAAPGGEPLPRVAALADTLDPGTPAGQLLARLAPSPPAAAAGPSPSTAATVDEAAERYAVELGAARGAVATAEARVRHELRLETVQDVRRRLRELLRSAEERGAREAAP